MRTGPAAPPITLRGASVEELTDVFGIGQVVAEGIVRFFADEHTRDTLHRLHRRRRDRRGAGARRIGRADARGRCRARRSS